MNTVAKIKNRCLMLLLLLLTTGHVHAYDDLLRWGISAGGNITKANSDGDGLMHTGWQFDSSGGYYVGVTLKLGLPLTGLGIDGSLYYSQEMVDIGTNNIWMTDKLRYFTIPVHLRYDLEVPGIDNALVPFGFVGPQCSLALNDYDWYRLLSTDPLSTLTTYSPTENYTADQIWKLDLGFGLIIMGHVQIAYSYDVPLNTAFRFKTIYNEASENFKMGCHRIGMTYYF